MGSFKDGFIRLLKNIVEKAEREKELEEQAIANKAAALAAKQAEDELARTKAQPEPSEIISANLSETSGTVSEKIADTSIYLSDSIMLDSVNLEGAVTESLTGSAPEATLHSLLHTGKDSLSTRFLSNVKDEPISLPPSNLAKDMPVDPSVPRASLDSSWKHVDDKEEKDQGREQTLRIVPEVKTEIKTEIKAEIKAGSSSELLLESQSETKVEAEQRLITFNAAAEPAKTETSEATITSEKLERVQSIDQIAKIDVSEKVAKTDKIEKTEKPRHEIHQTRLYSGSSEEEPTLLAAQWRCTPDDTLVSRSSTPTEESFKQAAENISTSPSTLAWLSSLVSPEVRASVASNAQTPPETLRKLANDVDNTVRLSVATNPSTPTDVLRTLTRDNSKLTASEAQKAMSERGDVVEAERKSQNLLTNNRFNPTSNHLIASYTTLDAVAPEGINEGSKADSEWQSLNTDNARKAYKQQKDTVKDLKFNHSVASNGPRKALPVIPSAFDKPPENATPAEQVLFYKMMATRLSTPPVRLTELAAHHSIEVRAAVAENVNSPVEAFLLLARDSEAQVKLRVIDNSSCPANILEMLRDDPDPYVGYEAKNQLKRLTQATTYEKIISHATEGLI